MLSGASWALVAREILTAREPLGARRWRSSRASGPPGRLRVSPERASQLPGTQNWSSSAPLDRLGAQNHRNSMLQILDPESGKTLGAVSTLSPSVVAEGNTGNIDAAKKVGAALAALAREKQIEQVVFNRNGFLYHGRVKALAEAAREAGLQF